MKNNKSAEEMIFKNLSSQPLDITKVKLNHEHIKISNDVLMNYAQRRRMSRELTKKIMKSSETYDFCKRDRVKINKLIMNTLKFMNETNIHAAEHSLRIDLTDESIIHCFKHFDNPNVEIAEIDDCFFFVRPEEQTKPERQTEVYQMENMLDILKGSVKPKVTFVVKTDEKYEKKIYVYDGQHRLLLVFDFIYGGSSYKKEALIKAFDKKMDMWPDPENWCDEWKCIYQFAKTLDKDEFTYKDLLRSVPEIKEVFEDPEKMLVKGDLHMCDNNTANLLFRKLNEQVSGHSTTQRVKADLVGTKFSQLMFRTKFKLNKNFEGYLSDLVPLIGLFNHGLGENRSTSPNTFGYDLDNLDDQKRMNMDQFLIFIYQMMLCRIEKTSISIPDGDKWATKPIYRFNKNVKLSDSEFVADNVHLEGSAWRPTVINPKTYDFWFERFKDLQIENEDDFTDYLRDVLETALIVNDQSFSSVAQRWLEKLKTKMKPFQEEIDAIDRQYPGENWTKPSVIVPEEIPPRRADLKFAQACLEQYKFANKDQFIVLLSFALSSKMAKYDLDDWLVGFVETMISNFQTAFSDSNVQIRCFSYNCRGTRRRVTFQKDDYGHNTVFPTMVSEHLQSVDNSLWKRYEATEKYIKEILDHQDTRLYKCPHTCQWVTADDYQSHHLHFRSEGDANKLFEYWFPLSAKFNNHISDDHQKNIVDVKTDGNFVDACNSMIDMMNNKIKQTSDAREIMDWKKSIRTLEDWRDRAEYYIEESK